MDNRILEEIKNQEPIFLQKDKSKKGWICPVCGSGSGTAGTGLTRGTKNKQIYTCWSCGKQYGILDLIGAEFGLPSFTDQLNKAIEVYNIQGVQDYRQTPKPLSEAKPDRAESQPKVEPLPDYTEYYKQTINQNDYSFLLARSITQATQQKFWIGFDPGWQNPKKPTAPTSSRIIIPRTKYSYLARAVDPNTPDRYQKMVAGKEALFNIRSLDQGNPTFIVEGEIDCMSLDQLGFNCLGLGSASNSKLFLKSIPEDYTAGFILMLDSDSAGLEAQQKLLKELQNRGIPVVAAEPQTEKDPNEMLIKDPQKLEQLCLSLLDELKTREQEHKYNAGELLDYFRNIEQQPPILEISTGFKELDRHLDGGLRAGLYIIGAISSLGKTSFCLQLADQIAEQGQDVLFFSLEMSKYELMAKSISRNTYQVAREAKTSKGSYLAKDTVEILNNRRYQYYTKQERETISQAIERYQKPAQHLYIYEGKYKNHRIGVQDIREIVAEHKTQTGNTPVVFVDYLQLLAPLDTKSSDKQNTDYSVSELKEISRDYNTPVFAISSFNRENYGTEVSMSSFKESGAIEYSSDILFGLQYWADIEPNDKPNNISKKITQARKQAEADNKNKKPVQIELKCLKNRNGYKFRVYYSMLAVFNSFDELTLDYESFTQSRGFEQFGEDVTPEPQDLERTRIDQQTEQIKLKI